MHRPFSRRHTYFPLILLLLFSCFGLIVFPSRFGVIYCERAAAVSKLVCCLVMMAHARPKTGGQFTSVIFLRTFPDSKLPVYPFRMRMHVMFSLSQRNNIRKSIKTFRKKGFVTPKITGGRGAPGVGLHHYQVTPQNIEISM